ncbi:hypothetical protein Scep_021624 [Stephania cephalantha]|uniref:Uncharacterized protein n=1 Tax=Stephania cephalantha TaxID=152367 RepID=A0AAP0F6D1_9MAGN
MSFEKSSHNYLLILFLANRSMIQVSLYFHFALLGCFCELLLHDMLYACAPHLIN